MPQFGSDAGRSRQLERRSGGRARPPSPDGSPRQSLQVTPAAFKQILIKYLRRQTRYGRMFCVAVLEILEYEQVKRTLGPQAALNLNRVGQEVITRCIRDADRMCGACPGKYLLLLPDTDAGNARIALERLAQLTAAARTHYHHKQLRASCSYRIVESSPYGSDPEVLLSALGFEIDEDGNLNQRGAPELAGGADLVRGEPFSGSFGVWLQRYREMEIGGASPGAGKLMVARGSARDLWRDSTPVCVRVVEPAQAGTTFGTDQVDTLSRRSRVLQAVDHPGVVGCVDYHLKDRRSFYLVQDAFEGKPLAEYLSGSRIDGLTVLDWALQICNSIVYLQGLMPPVVPPPPAKDSIVVSADKDVVLIGFELQYLFPAAHGPGQISGDEMMAVAQGRPVAAYTSVLAGFADLAAWLLEHLDHPPDRLASLFARLRQDELPPDLNTVYKLRAALRRIWEAERLQAVAGS